MRKLTKRQRRLTTRLAAILPDWRVMPCDCANDSICFEIEAWSPAGEDVIITLYGDTLAELKHDAYEQWQDFDADGHAAKIYEAKHSGDAHMERFYAAAPDSLRDLMEDAEAIDGMYEAVYRAILEAA